MRRLGLMLCVRLGILAGLVLGALALAGCRYPDRANTGVERLTPEQVGALRDAISERGYCSEYIQLEIEGGVCDCRKIKNSCGYLCVCGDRVLGE